MNTDNCSGNPQEPGKKIEDKLNQLEHDIEKQHPQVPSPVNSQDLLRPNTPALVKDDLYYFSGIALIAFGLLVFFQHVRIGTGILQAFGMGTGGFGLLLLPLLIGIGLIVYNRKNKLGYVVLSLSCAIIFYSVLGSLIMTFSPVSLLGLIIMLVPLAVGGAFFVKGMGGPKGIEHELRQQGLLKSEIKSE